jgi:hypothetical protein
MLKWEYKSVNIDWNLKSLFGGKGVKLEPQFNELGAQGWELVNMIGLGTGGSAQNGVQAVFKRPVSA